MHVNRFVIHTCLAVLSVGCALLSPGMAQGQEQPSPGQSEPSHAAPASRAAARARARGAYRKHAIDDRVRQFSKALDLNETQQAGLKAILERQQMRGRQIQLDSNIAGQERIDRFRALQEDTVVRIRSLLNDEQKKKYDPRAHSRQDTSSSDKYLVQWMESHQRTSAQPQSKQK